MPGLPFQTRRLILCEGIEDAAFLRALIRNRSLGAFDVRAVEDVGGSSGIGGFAKALTATVTQTGFPNIRSLVLAADSDQQHGKAFSGICAQIAKANRDQNVSGLFSIPNTSYRISGGNPRVIILLLPAESTNGALETLLLRALTGKPQYNEALACIEEFVDCAGILHGANRWHYSKLDKVRLHALISVTNKKNPALGLGKLWAQYSSFISLEDPAFDDIATSLGAVPS
jgi:hypothetical protein